MRALGVLLVCAMAVLRTDGAHALPLPSELRCEFELSVTATAASGSPNFVAEVHREPAVDTVTFSEFDRDTKTALAEGTSVDSNRPVFQAWSTTWTFMEVTWLGNLYVTQVFLEEEPGAADHVYRAVRSRQWTAMGQVFATQHYGHCKAVY